MVNLIASVVIIALLGGATAYIIRSRKKGQKCIGCPYSKTCGGKNCSCK